MLFPLFYFLFLSLFLYIRLTMPPERIRKFINMQYVKMKKLSGVGSLILLAINLSLVLYPYIAHIFSLTILLLPRVYILVPLIFIFLMVIVWIIAHIYIKIFEMYRTETRADIMYNPYQIYAIQPFQEMQFRFRLIPIMESLYDMMPEGKKKDDLKPTIDKMHNWCDLGFIPKGDFPEHLLKYYMTNKQSRL